MAALSTIKAEMDRCLREAIEQRHLLKLVYQNKIRIVEPHDYGIHNGSAKLLGYQIGGASSGRLPNWRWMEVDGITDFQILDQTFAGGRQVPTGKHYQWDELFIRVQPAKQAKGVG
ncbi:MAG TPA: hypothetical protein VFA65_17330 [Bryobacteraceae bacterium]|nr:hypothetical protein [Bryobacteraceae bacterium]